MKSESSLEGKENSCCVIKQIRAASLCFIYSPWHGRFQTRPDSRAKSRWETHPGKKKTIQSLPVTLTSCWEQYQLLCPCHTKGVVCSFLSELLCSFKVPKDYIRTPLIFKESQWVKHNTALSVFFVIPSVGMKVGGVCRSLPVLLYPKGPGSPASRPP